MTGSDDMDGMTGMRAVLREMFGALHEGGGSTEEWSALFGGYARLAEFELAVYRDVSSEKDNPNSRDVPDTDGPTDPGKNNHASRWAAYTSGLIVADNDGDTYMVVGRTTDGEPILVGYPKYGGGATPLAERVRTSALFTLGNVKDAYGPVTVPDEA